MTHLYIELTMEYCVIPDLALRGYPRLENHCWRAHAFICNGKLNILRVFVRLLFTQPILRPSLNSEACFQMLSRKGG
jgi:hypothetical protein